MLFRPSALIFEIAGLLAAVLFFAGGADWDCAFCSAQRLRCATAILFRAAALILRFVVDDVAGAALCLEAFGVAFWPSAARACSCIEISASSSAMIEAIDMGSSFPL